jgi:hypothetical protein
VISEFVNPKYKDASKTAFKSSTRLECMMQVRNRRARVWGCRWAGCTASACVLLRCAAHTARGVGWARRWRHSIVCTGAAGCDRLPSPLACAGLPQGAARQRQGRLHGAQPGGRRGGSYRRTCAAGVATPACFFGGGAQLWLQLLEPRSRCLPLRQLRSLPPTHPPGLG